MNLILRHTQADTNSLADFTSRYSAPHGINTAHDFMPRNARKSQTRHSDEPKLEIGDAVLIREGVVGLVLARSPLPVKGATKFTTSFS